MDHSSFNTVFFFEKRIDVQKTKNFFKAFFEKDGLNWKILLEGDDQFEANISGWASFHFSVKMKHVSGYYSNEIMFEFQYSQWEKYDHCVKQKYAKLLDLVISSLPLEISCMVTGQGSVFSEYFGSESIRDPRNFDLHPFLQNLNFIKFPFDVIFLSENQVKLIGIPLLKKSPVAIESVGDGLLLRMNTAKNEFISKSGFAASKYFQEVLSSQKLLYIEKNLNKEAK